MTIQAQIMDLILELREELGMSVLLITHDMGLVAQMADRVLVMYAGQMIEQAPVLELFDHPAHPYTRRSGTERNGSWNPLRALCRNSMIPLWDADLRTGVHTDRISAGILRQRRRSGPGIG